MMKAPRGRDKLEKVYSRILQLLKNAPNEAAYRKHTEAIICYRLAALNETKNRKTEEQRIRGFEEVICKGRIESLVKQAVDEYELIQHLLRWKPWDPLIENPPPDQWKWPPFNAS